VKTKRIALRKEDIILKVFSECLRQNLGRQVKRIILFGSRARGEAVPDSDYDILILVDKYTREIREQIRGIAWQIGYDNDVVIVTIVCEEQEFERRVYEPLFMNIRREGIIL